MSQRGAPAPQCDPSGLAPLPPDFLMSQPSSVRVMPLTRLSSAVADAKLLLGPVLPKSSPSKCWSFGSVVGQPESAYGAEPPTPVKLAFGSAIVALVGQPIPSSHAAWTRPVLAGSNSCGFTEKNPDGAAGSSTGAGSAATSVCPNWPGSSFGASPAEAPASESVAVVTAARASVTSKRLLIVPSCRGHLLKGS